MRPVHMVLRPLKQSFKRVLKTTEKNTLHDPCPVTTTYGEKSITNKINK
jgi:hypothetical protein